ncbi:NUMOD4 domain-containing protein [Parageobacillus thermantarcticus]
MQRRLDEQQEIWKDIPGFEGEYQVSNLGYVIGERLTLNFSLQLN